MLSDQYELAILAELRAHRHGGWLTAVELAQLADLPQFKVRALLSSLCRRRMVERGGTGHWGEYSITEHGIAELAAASQLRLIR